MCGKRVVSWVVKGVGHRVVGHRGVDQRGWLEGLVRGVSDKGVD
jgi:hypothetical protein